jgi:hypothetical protein
MKILVIYTVLIICSCGVYEKSIKNLPLYNYYIPLGDTLINDNNVKLSIQSNMYADSTYKVGMYANKVPIGKHFVFHLSDSILSYINNYVLLDSFVANLIGSNPKFPMDYPIGSSSLNSEYIYSDGRYSVLNSNFCFYREKDDSVCTGSHIPFSKIIGLDLLIEKKGTNFLRSISTNKSKICFEYRNENLQSKRNHAMLLATNLIDSSIHSYSYKLIETYFDYSLYDDFHTNDLRDHCKSGKTDLLTKFYKLVIDGESYYDEIDDRYIYKPKSKGEIPKNK